MNNIIEILNTLGPLTGKELLERAKIDEYSLWSFCSKSEYIITSIVGKRYLRFDKQVEGYARLSPSIMREFYGYTIVGTKKHLLDICKRARALQQEIKLISQRKFKLAEEIISKLVQSQKDSTIIGSCSCFIIAGDVAYRMSHSDPRPEPSTGQLVKGSDLDIIVVTEDLPDVISKALDNSILDKKYYLLKNPGFQEEIDYIVKDISIVEEQLKFEDFKSMIASKILHEGLFLYGSQQIFNKVKKMLIEKNIPNKLQALENKAISDRNNAEICLLTNSTEVISRQDSMKLFFTNEEKEEFI